MGTYKQGILGAFLGKVGNVVGSRWRGIDYMRSLATSVANPRTPDQVSNRNLFAAVVMYIRPFLISIRNGFVVGSSTSAWAAAVARNIAAQRANVSPVGGVWTINPQYLQLSNGQEPFSPTISGDQDSGYTITWLVEQGSALEFGKVQVVVFNENTRAVETFSTDASAGRIEISGIIAAASDRVRVYCFAYTRDVSSPTTTYAA